MDLKKSILKAKDNASKFIQKKWDEYKAEQRRQEQRRLLEKEAFTKAYESERIKLKAVEGKERAKAELFPTHRATIPADGSHPITKQDTLNKVQDLLTKT